MATIRPIFNSFSTGEVSNRFSARTDISRFYNSCKELENFLILPVGGVKKRPGTLYVADTIDQLQASRLIPFRADITTSYIVEISEAGLRVYDSQGVMLYENLSTPWIQSQIYDIGYAQYGDHLYLVHPDVKPYKLTRGSTWSFAAVQFYWGPFETLNTDSSKTLTCSVATGSGTLTASGFSPFEPGHVGSIWRLKDASTDGYVEVTGYTSNTEVSVTVKETVPTTATSEWAEGAFSDVRGYPRMVATVQSRGVFGGTRKSPSAVWFSVIADPENFATGANADDAFLIYLSSTEDPIIQWGVPVKNGLMVGTTAGTYSIAGASGGALTPTSFVAARSTAARSSHTSAELVNFEVASVSMHGDRIYLNSYALEFDSQVAKDMTFLVDHLFETAAAVELGWTQAPHPALWVSRQDGILAYCAYYALEKILGWARITTSGVIESFAVIPTTEGEEVWISVKRSIAGSDKRFLERLVLSDTTYYMDSHVRWSSGNTINAPHLANEVVKVVIDDALYPDIQVDGTGVATLPKTPERYAVIGLGYTAKIVLRDVGSSSPVDTYLGRPEKWGEAYVRVSNSILPHINGYSLQFREVEAPLGEPTEYRTGDFKIDALTGFESNQDVTIESPEPLRCEIIAFSGMVTVG